MNRNYVLFVLLVIVILCASCSTYISYPVSTPPEIETDGQHKRIVFINRFDYSNLPIDDDKEKEVYISGVRHLIEKLELTFSSDKNFNFIIIDTLMKGITTEELPEVLKADKISTICNNQNADMLLALESFKPFFSIETVTEKYDDGSRSTTNYVDLIVEAGLSLYDRSGDVINRILISESNHYQTRPALSRFIVIGPSMGNAGKEVNDLASQIVSNYIRSFYPGSVTVMKMIYIGKAFSEVTPRFRSQDWAGAFELLKPLAGSPNPKLARKAAHNLAIAYEAMGDYKAYENWIKKSME
ncbi:MAG: hypothetical protein ISS19_15890 [Bacteroidales bacterium]|nr:hypothetical protein [Bacteroidales bacterium]